MVVPLHRVNVWADLGQFSSVLVNLLCPIHNPFRDSLWVTQTKNAVNSLQTPWSPRNCTGITGDDVDLRSCSSLQGYVQLSRAFEHELLYALSSTIIDYHQLSWKLKLPSTIINYDDRFNRAQRFAESLRMRRYSNITVPIALKLSNFCSINNNTVGDGWLLVMTLRTLVLVLWMSLRLKLDIKDI